MNHQVFITNTNSALKTYFDKVEKEYESEKSSLRHELNKKDEIIKNLHNTITTNEKEIRRLSINEKKLTEDYEDFSKVSLLKSAHKNYDNVVKEKNILIKQINKYKRQFEDIKRTKKTLEDKQTIKPTVINTEGEIALTRFSDTPNVDKSLLLKRIEKYQKEIESLKKRIDDTDETISIEINEISKKSEDIPNASGNESITNEETDEETEEEEIELDLFKIKRKNYYASQEDDGVREIYAAIKVKKNEYDIGDYIGEYSNGILTLEAQ